MKVIGYRNVDFNSADGNRVQGVSFFCSYPITKNGSGEASEKFFLSNKKLENSGYFPNIGDEIKVTYNRFGKVDSISPV